MSLLRVRPSAAAEESDGRADSGVLEQALEGQDAAPQPSSEPQPAKSQSHYARSYPRKGHLYRVTRPLLKRTIAISVEGGLARVVVFKGREVVSWGPLSFPATRRSKSLAQKTPPKTRRRHPFETF
jgi:hypothetical protein